MKKLHKLFFALSFIFLIASCSSDDDNSQAGPSGFIDTWKYVGYMEDGEYNSDIDECESNIIEFKADNTGSINIEDCDFGNVLLTFTWQDNNNGTYTLDIQDENVANNELDIMLTFPEGDDKLHLTIVGDENYSEVYIRQ